ncbi:hypothetical protein Pelo_19178 [Pelomyxa schiedti]|nr:hypothetical protein Pelo_19178 [Pelomyxa schiedti]
MFLRFSLSRALNSVTRRPADPISCIRGKAVIGASDPDHVVTRQYAARPDRVVSFDLVHVETGTDRVLMPEGDESAVVYVGRKWLVHCTGSGSLTLRSLAAEHAEVRLGNCLPENAYSCAGIVQGVRGDSDHVMFSDFSAQLWDCNNTAAPLRVVPGRPSIAGVTAESGFLFHRGFDRKIDVTDPHGALVANSNTTAPHPQHHPTTTNLWVGGGPEHHHVAAHNVRPHVQIAGIIGATPGLLTTHPPPPTSAAHAGPHERVRRSAAATDLQARHDAAT